MRLVRTGRSALAAVVVAAAVPLGAAYATDIRRAYGHLRGASTVVSSPYGDIEYRSGGSGLPVLVIHGSGGGCDQGELLAGAVLGQGCEGFRWIAPSRFGYLRSTFREGATFDEQAHAYACLLDHLEIEKAAVVALSHGGPSALLFAALHPERVTSLSLISCGVASSTVEGQGAANRRGATLAALFQHDAPYWVVSRLLRRRLMALMGADGAIVAAMSAEQRRSVAAFIEGMNPASPRAAGTAFDNTAAMPNQRIAAVRAATLIVHAKDDRLQLYHNAEFAARTVPQARLLGFERGGHLLIAVEQPAVSRAVREHVLGHAD